MQRPMRRIGRSGHAVTVQARTQLRQAARIAETELTRLQSRRNEADVAVFHEFVPAPTGGGSQFLRALVGELRRRGLQVEIGQISGRTPVCLFNSFNFDLWRLRRFARADCRMVHRVDGPIGTYRGFDDGTDRRILAANNRLADATILQSQYSLAKHRQLGLEPRNPVVIPNTVDPAIFHPPAEREPIGNRKVKLIASSWSDNLRKGAATIAWLDTHLDHGRYELAFVGRSPIRFQHATMIDPVPSEPLAELLRVHDIYIAPSLDDPCSNALLEALACGLPAAYAESGGHPELVGQAGLPFTTTEELPDLLDQLTDELEVRRGAIAIPALADITDRYLAVLLDETHEAHDDLETLLGR